jgi:hypothetical protein
MNNTILSKHILTSFPWRVTSLLDYPIFVIIYQEKSMACLFDAHSLIPKTRNTKKHKITLAWKKVTSLTLVQGWAKYGPRAKFGPPSSFCTVSSKIWWKIITVKYSLFIRFGPRTKKIGHPCTCGKWSKHLLFNWFWISAF